MPTVASLFEPRPHRWGLRGDPHLWWEMRTRLATTELPESADALEELIAAMFEESAGVPITHPEDVHVPKYDHGGMTGGWLVPRWWRETAIPLLRGRLEEQLGQDFQE